MNVAAWFRDLVLVCIGSLVFVWLLQLHYGGLRVVVNGQMYILEMKP